MQKQNKAKISSFTKRLQCIVCATFMLLTTLLTEPLKPLEAKAEIEGILRIAGVIVTEENASDILGNGVFSYDAVQKKLKINGDFNYDDSHYDLIGNHSIDGLKIYVASDSNLTMIPGSGAFYINADTTITGPGVLTLEQRYVPIEIAHGNLMIKDAKVNLISTTGGQGSCGINLENDSKLEVINSDLTITCSDESQRGAIYGYKSKLAIADCEIVTPEGGEIKDVFIDEDSSYQTIVDADGKPANIVKTTSIPRVVDYAVIPNSKTIKKDCYNDPDYLAGNKTLKFSAAGNERESAHLILNSTKGIDKITVEKSDLTDPDEHIIRADNIDIFWEYYIYEKNLNKWETTDIQGYHADALLPYELAVELGENRLVTCDGNNQGIWFTLNVPAGQAKGTYKGEFKINISGGNPITVPVEVEVHNFDLPDQTYSRSNYTTSQHKTPKIYNDMVGIDNENDYKKTVNNIINDRRLSTGYPNAEAYINSSSVEEEINNLNNYINAVYDYVTKSEAPYYNLNHINSGFSKTTIFNNFNFDITEEYLNVINDPTEREKLISDKRNEIIKVFEELYQDEIEANSEKEKAITFAVDTYLYYNLRFYTHTLREGDLENYIEHDYHLADYDGYFKDLFEKNKSFADRLSYVNGCCNYAKNSTMLQKLYNGLIFSGSVEGIDPNAGIELARNLFPHTRINPYDSDDHIGIETIIKGLVDKSFDENTDLLKYCYLYSPYIDEPAPYNYWANIEVLINDKIISETKKDVKQYIKTKYNDHPLKANILESVDSILFLPTMTAIDDIKYTYINQECFTMKNVRNYSAMVYKGMGYENLGYNGIGIIHNENNLNEINYTEEMPMKLYKDGYKKGATPEAYTISIPFDYTVKNYCPLFNDFSNTVKSAFDAKDYGATMEALKDPDINMWWYSCMSDANPLLACNYIAGNNSNEEKYNNIHGNSLAIYRANKWQQFKMGIKGELYWSVDKYVDDNGKYNKKMWEVTTDKCNSASMIYPIYSLLHYTLGKSEEEAKALCQKYGYFASSVRIENLAEANDDYDYLCIANDLIKKAALAGESRENIAYWTNYINDLYDSMFDDVDYDENANSENLRVAREKLARLIENLQTKTRKAVVYEVIPGDCDKIDFKLAYNIIGGYLSDYIHLDFTDCTASVGTLTKKGNIYEYVLPVVELPTTTESMTSDLQGIYADYFTTDEEYKIVRDNSSISFVRKDTVDLVTPLRSNGYTVNRFWNKSFDESYSDWKKSGKEISFEIKATPLKCEKIKDNKDNIKTYSSIYFNQASPWRGTTKPVYLDPVEGTYNGIKGEQLDHGWYRITIPFSSLEEQSSDVAQNTIDMIEATWINKSFAIRNISISDAAAQPPTGIKPVNRTVWGDANCDGGVDLSDAVLIMQSIANPNKYGLGGTSPSAITQKGKELADVDTSIKGITGNDALKIQKYLLNLISSLNPIE